MDRRQLLGGLTNSVLIGSLGSLLTACGKEEAKNTPTNTSTPPPLPTPTDAKSTDVAPTPNNDPYKDGLVRGGDFKEIDSPQPPTNPKLVEVMEFFSYLCPHCNALEPVLEAWEAKLPKDVVLKRSPIVLHDNLFAQKAFFALEATGKLPELHQKMFDAIHKDKMNANSAEDFAAIAEKLGLDKAKFLDSMKSFSVESGAKRATRLADEMHVSGVPTFVIQNQYITSPNISQRGPEQFFPLVDKLIERKRKDLNKK